MSASGTNGTIATSGTSGTSADGRHDEAILAACRALHAAEGPVPLDALAAGAGLSGSHFQRLFRSRLGVTPRQYASHLQRARAQVALGQLPRVTDALFEAGFESPSRFYERARAMLGMTPSAWRDGGRGVTIEHAVVDTALGPLLVAATENGVCRVDFGEIDSVRDDARRDGHGHEDGSRNGGENGGGRGGAHGGERRSANGGGREEGERHAAAATPEALVAALAARFPNATLAPGGTRFHRTVDAVAALVSEASVARRERIAVPLDVEGTLFQSQVWRVLQGIPAGRTMSYADVAAALGRPRAHRAVAGACGANPVALLIPCHRVTRRGGGLGGYRWGVARKRALLAAERA